MVSSVTVEPAAVSIEAFTVAVDAAEFDVFVSVFVLEFIISS